MRYFIFITNEGYTYQPESNAVEPDVENCQVLGFCRGKEVNEAYKDFIAENPWLKETTFNEVIAYELKNEDISGYFYLENLE